MIIIPILLKIVANATVLFSKSAIIKTSKANNKLKIEIENQGGFNYEILCM